MAKKTLDKSAENTALRLKAVLEVLAAEDPAAERRISRGEVLAAAVTRVPLEGREAEVMASGAPRGERALSTATGKLVKAGWISKEGRAGWSITAPGRQALKDFPETADLIAALGGKAPAAGVSGGTETAGTSAPAAEGVEEIIEAALLEAVASPAVPQEQHGAHQGTELPEPSFPQPEAVVVAGSLGSVLGQADWDPAGTDLELIFDHSDELWKLTVDLPTGHYEYKVALDGSWEENYGRDGHHGGHNLELEHDGGPLTFLYDHATHLVVTKADVNA